MFSSLRLAALVVGAAVVATSVVANVAQAAPSGLKATSRVVTISSKCSITATLAMDPDFASRKIKALASRSSGCSAGINIALAINEAWIPSRTWTVSADGVKAFPAPSTPGGIVGYRAMCSKYYKLDVRVPSQPKLGGTTDVTYYGC